MDIPRHAFCLRIALSQPLNALCINPLRFPDPCTGIQCFLSIVSSSRIRSSMFSRLACTIASQS